jgi:hypothetical protein
MALLQITPGTLMPPRLISDIIVGTPPILIIAFSHLTSTVVRAPSVLQYLSVSFGTSALKLFHFSSQIWIVISIDGPDLFHVRSSFVRFLNCH